MQAIPKQPPGLRADAFNLHKSIGLTVAHLTVSWVLVAALALRVAAAVRHWLVDRDGRLVDVHPDLKRSRTERSVGHDCDRHAVEAANPRDLVRRHLPEPESAMREVPQRPFSFQRLVDTLDGRAIAPWPS